MLQIAMNVSSDVQFCVHHLKLTINANIVLVELIQHVHRVL